MIGVRVDSFLKTVPLNLPFVHEFATGFVASATQMTKEKAQGILECMTFCVPDAGLFCVPVFHWCPLLQDYAVDMVKGRPTDQSALIWDHPCGSEMAEDETAVYAGIDRTIPTNDSWRRLDPAGWILAVRNRSNIPGEAEEYLLACVLQKRA